MVMQEGMDPNQVMMEGAPTDHQIQEDIDEEDEMDDADEDGEAENEDDEEDVND